MDAKEIADIKARQRLLDAAPALYEACEALLEEVEYQMTIGNFAAKLSVREKCLLALSLARGGK